MSGDTPVTWSQKAGDDQANAADALSAAAARLDMVGRGPMSPPKDPRPREAPKSDNRRPRKPGGAGFAGAVVTEDGETAEVPPNMAAEVGGRSMFDNVSVDGDESEEAEEEPTKFKCERVGCNESYDTLSKLKTHARSCKCPPKPLVPVDDDAAAQLSAFDESHKAAPHKRDFVVKELARYKTTKQTKRWSGTKRLEELRKLIANGAETLEKQEDAVKPVVAWLANGGDGAQKYLCLGGRQQAAKLGSLDYAEKVDLGLSGLNKLIKRVADGKEKHDIVGARWPTEGDWTDATITKIARDTGGGGHAHAETLGKIETARKDDHATREADLAATDAADAATFQAWCRVAHATPTVGAPDWTRKVDASGTPYWEDEVTGRTRLDDPWAFVATPRVALPTEPEALKLAIAATYASRPRGRGLGDLVSPDPAVRARAVAAGTGDAGAYDASRAPAWEEDSV